MASLLTIDDFLVSKIAVYVTNVGYIFLIIVDFSKMAAGCGLLVLPEEMLIKIAKHLGKGQFFKEVSVIMQI